MRVLVACEESQAVTIAMRGMGHEAFSCDILESSGGHPEWHIQGDVLVELEKTWDMIIAFPPCTHLAVSGAAHFKKKREDGRQRAAIEFFMALYNAKAPKIALENPVGIMSGTYIGKHYPDLVEKYGLPLPQPSYVQPYEYGTPTTKKTGLWLKGLNPLQPTNIVKPDPPRILGNGKTMSQWFYETSCLPQSQRHTARSKTFPGIAKAMAEQWGGSTITKKQKMRNFLEL